MGFVSYVDSSSGWYWKLFEGYTTRDTDSIHLIII